MKHTRCEEVLVLMVVRQYDDLGRPVGERVIGRPNGSGGMDAIKIFRNAQTQDFWGEVDKAVKAMSAPPADAPLPAGLKKGKKR